MTNFAVYIPEIAVDSVGDVLALGVIRLLINAAQNIGSAPPAALHSIFIGYAQKKHHGSVNVPQIVEGDALKARRRHPANKSLINSLPRKRRDIIAVDSIDKPLNLWRLSR